MKKTFAVLALVMLTALLGFGQTFTSYQVGGVLQPAAFNGYTFYSTSAVSGAGSASVGVINSPFGAGVNVPSGCFVPTQGFGAVQFTPIAVGNIVTFLDANAEAVTITAATATPSGTCSLTATFTAAHNAGAPIISGTGGYQDAIAFAKTLQNGGTVAFQNQELVTLSTGGLTTDTTANLLPAQSYIDMVTGVVNTTITAACTGWQLGDPTTAGRFTASDTTLTAGESVPKVATIPPVQTGSGTASATTGIYQGAAAKVRITCATGNPGAGKVRVVVTGRTIVPPTS